MEISKNKKKWKVIMVLPVIMAGALLYTMSGGSPSLTEGTDSLPETDRSGDIVVEEEHQNLPGGEKTSIYVDVGGAVREPQVVMLEEGARVFQAIEAAGGQREDADLRSINLAAVCDDGQKIYVPAEEEQEEMSFNGSGTAASSSADTGDPVNINTADSAELQTLSGVGPGIAQRIIDYRTSEGSFRSIEDLKNVNGIGDKTFEKLKDHICV